MRLYMKVRPIVEPVTVEIEIEATGDESDLDVRKQAVRDAFDRRKEFTDSVDWPSVLADVEMSGEVVEVATSVTASWPQKTIRVDLR